MKEKELRQGQYLIAVASPNRYLIRDTEYDSQVISAALEELGFANKIIVLWL